MKVKPRSNQGQKKSKTPNRARAQRLIQMFLEPEPLSKRLFGTTTQTEADMDTIARFFERVLIEKEEPGLVQKDVEDFRLPLQKFYYCFDNGWPPSIAKADKKRV